MREETTFERDLRWAREWKAVSSPKSLPEAISLASREAVARYFQRQTEREACAKWQFPSFNADGTTRA